MTTSSPCPRCGSVFDPHTCHAHGTGVRVWVPGAPMPQGSKRIVRGSRLIDVNPVPLRRWRDAIAAAITTQVGHGHSLPGPMRVECQFQLTRPKTHLDSRGAVKPAAPVWHDKRPDIDKLARAVLDACTYALGTWNDDAQVAALHCTKCWTHDQPGLLLTITPIR